LATSATRTPTHASKPVPIIQNVSGLMKLATTIMTTASSVGVAVVLQMGAVQDATMMTSTVPTPSLSVTKIATLVVVRMTMIAMLPTSAIQTPTPVNQSPMNVRQMPTVMMASPEFVRLEWQSRLSANIARMLVTEMCASQAASTTLVPVIFHVVHPQLQFVTRKLTSAKLILVLFCSQRWCSLPEAVKDVTKKG